MKKSTKTSIFRFAYIGVTVLVIFLIGMYQSNFNDLSAAIEKINVLWLMGAIGCTLAYWLTDAWLLQFITDAMTDENRLSYWNSLKIGLIGLYYGALTPSSVGAQPMQIVYMSREKIPVGKSTCIVVIKFIAYSLTVIAYYFISHALVGSEYLANSPAIYWLSIVGLVLNIFAVSFFTLSIIKEKMVLSLGHGVIAFLHKIKLMKHTEKPTQEFDKTIADYTGTTKYIQDHKLRLVGAFFISFINIGFMFMITYFVYRAFNLNNSTYIGVMSVQALLYVAIHYFPMPGGAGAAEGGFFAIFSVFFPQNLIFMAMLVWRILTYYILLAVGSLVVVFDEFINLRKQKKAQQNLAE